MSLHATPTDPPHRPAQRRPNLFCVGAMKSGTTYLSGLLGSHPEIFICSPREPCHFSEPRELRRVWPGAWQLGYWRSQADYLRLFEGAGQVKYAGESSTTYSQAPVIPSVVARIHAFAPQARIIYLMRDPVERTISHYWHMVRWHFEYRAPLTAIRHDPYYMATSHYSSQLAPYLELFGRGQVLALTYEELIRDPTSTLRSVFSWLGVAPEFDPPAIDNPVNVTPEVIEQARAFGLLKRLRQSNAWGRVAPWVPAAWRRRLTRMSVKRVSPASTPMDEVVDYLRPIQLAQTRELSALLGRGFAEWTSLMPSRASGGRAATARVIADEVAT